MKFNGSQYINTGYDSYQISYGAELDFSFKFDNSVTSNDTMFIVSERENKDDAHDVTFLLHNGKLTFDWGSQRKALDKPINVASVYHVNIRNATCNVYENGKPFGTISLKKESIYSQIFLLGASWLIEYSNENIDQRGFKGVMYWFNVIEHHSSITITYKPISESCMSVHNSGYEDDYLVCVEDIG